MPASPARTTALRQQWRRPYLDTMPIFCSDKEFDASKHPCSKLWCHISQKGIQGGAVLGAAAVVPAMAAHAVLARGVPVQDLKKPEEALKLLSGAAYTAIGAIAATCA